MYKPDSKVLDELYTEKYKSVRLLIEAAPDMLRALERLVQAYMDADGDAELWTDPLGDEIEAAREAIAKARPKEDADAEETKQDMEAP